jgi:hypothetical protein
MGTRNAVSPITALNTFTTNPGTRGTFIGFPPSSYLFFLKR